MNITIRDYVQTSYWSFMSHSEVTCTSQGVGWASVTGSSTSHHMRTQQHLHIFTHSTQIFQFSVRKHIMYTSVIREGSGNRCKGKHCAIWMDIELAVKDK